MDQAVVGATIQVVLQTLLSASIEEIKLVFGFKKDLTKLQKSLLMIQDFLHDAQVKQVNNIAVKRWLQNLEDVAFEADAVLGECNYEILRKKVKKQKRTSNKVLGLLPSGPKNLLFHRKMAHKIEEVNKNLDRINSEAQSFGLQMLAMITDTSSSSVGFITPPTDSLSIEARIVGRYDDESKIVEMLLSVAQAETISVIPILGMGGLGKTTLTRKVFHHVKIGAHFEKRIWVSVSTNFDATSLFKMILESLSGENVQAILTKEAVLEKIRKHLVNTPYLLVLDDVWNENSNDWNDFMSSLLGVSPVKGNSIVVTTRKGKVASLVGTLPSYQLHVLSKDDCWSIIKSKAFSNVDVPTEFEEIGHCMAQRCGGLPLAAKVVGGLLRGKSKNEWEAILADQLSEFGLGDGSVMHILKLSYDRLPSSTLKKCFAYCSIFPQDFYINIKQLIELWMAQGFLQARRGKDMEAVGDEIFNFLWQNSLFQDVERDEYGNITYCRMHDLVHDLARSVSGSRTVTMEDGTSDGLHQPRYLATEQIGRESFAVLKQHSKYLRTVFAGREIVAMFLGFKQLHALKLMDESIEELPDVIGELIHLRLLDTSETLIRYLPDSIGKLYNLQTILLPHSLRNLPSTIVDLISLRHLHISDGIELPPWMGKLTCLQTLPNYKVGHEQGCGIGELGKLTNLKGFLDIQNVEKVKDKAEAQRANLLAKANMFGLTFKWSESREGEINDEDVLNGLQPHPGLKSLKILRYNGRKFPSWTMKMATQDGINGHGKVLDNLIKIVLMNCNECEEVPMFGHLPHLKFLKLGGLSNLRAIGRSFYGFINHNTSSMIGEPMIAFPALEKLQLLVMPELSEWAEVEETIAVFPRLKDLEIKGCPKLKKRLPSNFPCLEHLTIHNCPELKTSVPSHLPCLEELDVNDVDADFCLTDVCSSASHLLSIKITSLPGLTCFPEEVLVKNQNLSKLFIENCPKLMRLVLCSRGGGVSSLHELSIYSCPALKSIPTVKGLTSLRKLIISSCEKLRELPLDLNSLGSLEVLHISTCPELESVPSVRSLTSLGKLEIRWCANLRELPPDLNTLQSLEVLKVFHCLELKSILIPSMESFFCPLVSLGLGGFSNSLSLDSFNQELNQLLPNLGSLERLHLYGKRNWESLPDAIQHLTSLKELTLSTFGMIEALPEWIGSFSSLEWLCLQNCRRLRHLPSKEAMQRLTKLDRLSILACPLMAER